MSERANGDRHPDAAELRAAYLENALKVLKGVLANEAPDVLRGFAEKAIDAKARLEILEGARNPAEDAEKEG